MATMTTFFGQPKFFTLAMLSMFMLGGLSGSPASAVSLYWDANDVTAGTGGTGNWNTTNSVWRNSSAVGALQLWANGNQAVLQGTVGTVTLQENITLSSSGGSGSLSATNGYTIDTAPGPFSLKFLNPDADTFMVGIDGGTGTLTMKAPVIIENASFSTPMTFWSRDSVIFDGAISDGGVAHTFEVVDSSTVTLNAANSLVGSVTAQSGSKIVIGHNNALGSAALAWSSGMLLEAGGGDRVISNTISPVNWNIARTISGSNDFTFTGSYQVLSAFGTSSFASLNISAADGQATLGNFTTLTSGANGGFKKLGAGTMILNGTFAPGNMNMTIEAGKMLVNTTSTITTGGADFLVTTGTLGGTGTINLGAGSVIDVSVGGTLAPGASVGNLTVNGNVLLNGTLANEISGITSDLLTVNGNLTLGATSILNLLGTLTASSYTLASYTGTLTGTFGTINGLTGYEIDYGTGLNSTISLEAIPAPEPSSLLLLGLGTCLLSMKRKRTSLRAAQQCI